MTQTSLSPVVRHIRRLVAADLGRELSDTELLQRFAADREERAFLDQEKTPSPRRSARRSL
jgi:hypothetical protein